MTNVGYCYGFLHIFFFYFYVDAKSHMDIVGAGKSPGFISLSLTCLWVHVQQTSSGGTLVPLTTWNYVIVSLSYDFTF